MKQQIILGVVYEIQDLKIDLLNNEVTCFENNELKN